MQLWVGDYLGDTRNLTTTQHGAYLLLLMCMWRADGDLPNDDRQLARMAGMTVRGWLNIKDGVMPLFTVADGRITQKRLAEELLKCKSKTEKRACAGKAGGEAKALKDKELAVANAMRLPCHSSEPEPESESKKEKVVAAAPKGAAPKPKPDRGTRWPSDRQVPPDWFPPILDRFRELGRAPPDLRLEAVKFASYWAGKSGKDATKLDWPKTFLNWCLNARTDQRSFAQQRSDSLRTGASQAAFVDRERGEGVESSSDTVIRLAISGGA